MKKLSLVGAVAIASMMLVGCQQQTSEPTLDAESRKTVIPEECQYFFDGCNQCQKNEDGEATCTLMYCENYETPRCLDDEMMDEESSTDEELSIDEEVIQDTKDMYIGLPIEEAQNLAEQENISLRVVSLDGEEQAVTLDYMPGRINATVDEGVITDITIE